jgi:di/tricarboxylate transporter
VNWAKREFTLTWSEAKDIDWGTILLFGSGIIFGSLLADTGLAETIGTWGADTFGVSSELSITIFAVVLGVIDNVHFRCVLLPVALLGGEIGLILGEPASLAAAKAATV